MDKIIDTSKKVSANIADTLSELEKQNLRRLARSKQVLEDKTNTYSKALTRKGIMIANQWRNSNVKRNIQNHPVKAVGLVILTGLLVSAIFSRKDKNTSHEK